jgi:hypothetical protein
MNDALDADRLRRRREHLMSEITLEREAVAVAPARRAPRRALALASAGVLTAGAFVALSLRGDGGTAGTAFATERAADGTISVRVVDSDVSAKAMTRQLRAAGVDVRVETMPASPQLVGTWLYVSDDSRVPDSMARAIAEQTRGYVATLEVPAGLPGGLVLGVGRAPHRGEAVAVSGRRNALAPGGLLHCTRLSGAPAATAAAQLAGWTVRWAGGAPARGARVTLAYVSDDAPKTVELTALAPADPRYGPQSWLGYAPSARARDDRGWATGC